MWQTGGIDVFGKGWIKSGQKFSGCKLQKPNLNLLGTSRVHCLVCVNWRSGENESQ